MRGAAARHVAAITKPLLEWIEKNFKILIFLLQALISFNYTQIFAQILLI